MSSHSPSAAALRAALASRGGPPGAWRTTTTGVSDVDSFLCNLSHSITAALEIAVAEASHARLQSMRAALLFAVNSRCDHLEAGINAAASFKISALERELCGVDAVLEKLRAERGAAAEAAATLSDSAIVARHAELTARLDAADAQFLALPTTSVEPPHIGLLADEAALLATIAAFGRLVAPRAVTAANLALEGVQRRVRAGGSVRLRLALQGAHLAAQSVEELEVSLGAAAAATHVDPLLETPGRGAPQLLGAAASVDVRGRVVTVAIAIPVSAPAGSSIRFGPSGLTVSGLPVAGEVLPVPLLVEVGGAR